MKKITKFLAPELRDVERLLSQTLDSESRLIREVGDYVSLSRGKKLRPAMVLLAARALGGVNAPAELAASVELIHVATLIHDDVIDKASTRRGRPSVNAQFGDDVAILMADYLYARAFDLALTALSPQVMRLITQVTQKMCEGEMFQIEWRGRDLTPVDYIRVVERKTGQLFGACAALGALAAGRGPGEVESARQYGLNFGIAFQITDDLLDFTAKDDRWGKDIGMDVSGCKQTLPLLVAREIADPKDRALLDKCLSNGRELGPIIEILERSHSLERVQNEAATYAQRAAGSLAHLSIEDTEAFEFLRDLPLAIVNRSY